jgi:hypothetical protein
MTSLKINKLLQFTQNQDEEYSIPLDISDIINICQEYNKLGNSIQKQIETILDVGIEEAIKSGSVNSQSLPHIQNFFQQITKNAYFGDAISQAEEWIFLIEKHKVNLSSSLIN